MTAGAERSFGPVGFWRKCWDARRWLMWLPILICLLPLAYGQGWVSESILAMRHFGHPPQGLAYFFPVLGEQTRILMALPFALAALTPSPEWSIAALLIVTWLGVAGTTYAVAARLFPQDSTAAVVAFLLSGTAAYDISLLHAGYVPFLITSLLHWVGLWALLVYCETRRIRWLVASALLQTVSLLTYATAIPAIVIGPFLALALIASRSDLRRAMRPFVAIAAAWWLPALCYMGALAWVATQPGNYVTGGGLNPQPPGPYLWSAAKLVRANFDVRVWLHPHPYWSNPQRIFDSSTLWALAGLATALMVPLVIGASRRDAEAAAVRRSPSPWVLAVLFLAIVGSNLATVMVQESNLNFRTHVISRLYAAILIAAGCSALFRSRFGVVRAIGMLLTFSVLGIAAWTVADRASYLVSIWPRHRTELRSLDELVQKIDRKAAIVLFEPPDAGYTATIVWWHALPWIVLMRGDGSAPPQFEIWSPGRKADCSVRAAELECQGVLRSPARIPLRQLVVLRYDVGDCQYKLVRNTWVDDTPSPPDYSPQSWLLDRPLPSGEYFHRLVYGPQGLGRNIKCQ